jgi:hypothetical protein
MKLMGHMVWGSRKSLGGVGRSFLVLLDLRWETNPMLVFSKTYGVESGPLRGYT